MATHSWYISPEMVTRVIFVPPLLNRKSSSFIQWQQTCPPLQYI